MGGQAMDQRGNDELVAALRSGAEGGFEQAYRSYRARVFAFLLRMTCNRTTAEDLLQETWIRLAKNARKLRDDTNLRAWLFTVARNLYISETRRAGRGTRVHRELDPDELVDTETPHTLVAATEAGERLEAVLRKLPPRQREVLLLVGVEAMSPTEASVVLGESPTATRKRLSRARAVLKLELEK